MKIGIVGGVERNETQYRRIAEEAGHELVFHSGHVNGRAGDKLVEVARSVEVLVVLTDVNSHGAVGVARKAATKFGTPVLLMRRLGPSRFASELPQLASTAAAARRVA
jgi:hypothetical protein